MPNVAELRQHTVDLINVSLDWIESDARHPDLTMAIFMLSHGAFSLACLAAQMASTAPEKRCEHFVPAEDKVLAGAIWQLCAARCQTPLRPLPRAIRI